MPQQPAQPTPCNLCGALERRELSARDRRGRPLRTVICRGCGLVFSDPIPSREQLESFYTEDYRLQYKSSYEPRLKHVLRAGRLALLRLERFADILRPGLRALDIGSGGGEMVYMMRARGLEAAGIEPNRGYGAYAERELGLPIQLGFPHQARIEAGSLDAATMFHVLEHTADPLGELRLLHGWLRDGGHLAVEVPNLLSPMTAPAHRFHAAHVYNFSTPTLEALGRKAGFVVCRSERSADGANIHTVFRKTPGPAGADARMAEYYAQTLRSMAALTALKYYISTRPYAKALSKAARALGEARVCRRFSHGRQILDYLLKSRPSNPA